MQVISILLIAVSFLTLLSGVSVLLGARRGERAPAFLFFLATVFALCWAVFVGLFLILPEDTDLDIAQAVVTLYYVSAPLMCWALMAYSCHKFVAGRVLMGVFGAWALVLVYFVIFKDELLFENLRLSADTGNSVDLQRDWFMPFYGIYHVLTVLSYMVALLVARKKTKNLAFKRAYLVILVGFGITGILALLYNFIFTTFGKYDTIWVGPLAMSVAWVLHYYAILRYRVLDLAGAWLKVLSYIIIMSLSAIVFLAIFFVIFLSLFKVGKPSYEAILLNAIMVAVVILLFPVFNELWGYIRSLVDVHSVDLVYVTKQLSLMSREYINYDELVKFLSEHLHYQYIGIATNGKIYSSKNVNMSAELAAKITKTKAAKGSVWVEPDEEFRNDLKSAQVEAVAELRDPRGNVVGKILFGKPLGGINFYSRDIYEIETAMVLVAAAVGKNKV